MAFLAAQAPTSTTRLASSSRLGPLLALTMDPAAPEPVPTPATDTDAKTNGYEDASEFEDAEAGGEGAGAGTETRSRSGTMPAGGVAEMKELTEELAKGVVCLKCETSAEAAAAGLAEPVASTLSAPLMCRR
jgi:hypothetical protein